MAEAFAMIFPGNRADALLAINGLVSFGLTLHDKVISFPSAPNIVSLRFNNLSDKAGREQFPVIHFIFNKYKDPT